MIVCEIDGQKAYPATTEKIKITYENQFVKDSGSYTYDITFPMDIAENRKIFGNVQRFNVKKSVMKFEMCRLYADNRLIISGKGTVTTVSPDKVKLQIVGGKSRIKYNSLFEKHYIDEIDYPDVILDTGINKKPYDTAGVRYPNMSKQQWMVFIDLTTSNYVGQKGVAVMSPINDETNEIIANRIGYSKFTKIKIDGVKYPAGTYSYMYNCSVSPYLIYVLNKVIEHEGYTIKRNDLNKEPWNRLVIVNACKSGKIKDALPHWTVYKFIDELRKLFNASFIFDEEEKSLSIIATNELVSNESKEYECEDEFEVEYDEDGLDNIATSNIQYSFDSAANRDWREYISQSVQKNYQTKEYASGTEMVKAAEAMTTKERKTTIFKVGFNYYIWADLPKDGNPDNEETTEQRTQCGFFNPIIRDMESDTFQDLNIVPVAIYQRKLFDQKKTLKDNIDKMPNKYIVIPSVVNEKEDSIEDMEVDDDGEYYFSVQDAMEGSSEDTSTTEDDDGTKMTVAFQAKNLVNIGQQKPVAFDKVLDGEDTNLRFPVLYTDYRMYPDTLLNGNASMSLESLPNRSSRTFGNLDNGSGSSSRFGDKVINKNQQITIKFLTDAIPDPSDIFVFHNKKYICEKVEMNVTNGNIEKEKTGYFYEFN